MTPPTCPRCRQIIVSDDTIAFNGNLIIHADCSRPSDLSHEERMLLFKYCFRHTVAECVICGESFQHRQLGVDLLGNRTQLCPRCRIDLTASVREHLYACAVLPAEIRRRAEDARRTARRLLKDNRQLADRADVLMREAEAAVAALRETMTRFP